MRRSASGLCSRRSSSGPSAAAYANDTLVGTLIIGLAVLVPPTPGVSAVARMQGPDVPPGWDYNPRLRFINIVFGCALIAAPLMFAGGPVIADWTGAAAGLLLILLSLPRGPVHNQDRFVV